MRMILMEYRNIKDIAKDIEEVNVILFNMKKRLINNPNNHGLKTNILTMEYEKRNLIEEFEKTNIKLGKTSFDIHISNKNGGKIGLSELGHVSDTFQDLINSCSMYDGTNPVKKGSSLSKSIANNIALQVDAAESGSLILFVSSKSDQTVLNDDSYLKKGLEYLNEVIECGDNEGLLLDKMKTMGNQPIFKYKKLLKVLKDNKLNLGMYDSVAPKGFKPQHLTSEFAEKVYKVIDDTKNEKSDSIEIIGELYTINTHKNECSLEISSEDEKNGTNIRFSFDKEFKEDLKNNIEKIIHISLNRVIEYNPVEDNENITYKLKQII